MLLFLFYTLAALFIAELWRLNWSPSAPRRGQLAWPLLLNLPSIVPADANHALDQLWLAIAKRNKQAGGGAFVMQVPQMRWLLLDDARDIEFVLQSNFRSFERHPLVRELWGELLGDGIFTSNGTSWTRQRRFMVPIFSTASIERMLPTFAAHANDALLAPLRRVATATPATPIDVCTVFYGYTMSTFLSIGLGCDDVLSSDERASFGTAFDRMGVLLFKRLMFGKGALWRWMCGSEFDECHARVRAVLAKCIERRRRDSDEQLSSKNDIMSHALRWRDEAAGDNRAYTDHELSEIFLNSLLAGRDTSAVTLSLATYELGRRLPGRDAMWQHIVDEVERVAPNAAPDAPLSGDQVAALVYTKAVLMETLRMYPPVPFDGRCAVRDTQLPSGIVARKGDNVSVHIKSAGRLHFVDGDEFRPTRWLADDLASENDNGARFHNQRKCELGGVIPFFFGAQRCLGERMAYAQMLVVLATLARARVRCRLPVGASNDELRFVSDLVPKPAGGLPMLVEFGAAK